MLESYGKKRDFELTGEPLPSQRRLGIVPSLSSSRSMPPAASTTTSVWKWTMFSSRGLTQTPDCC